MDFFLLSRPRTGSTLLHRSLNQHPQIDCDGEVMSLSYERHRLPTESGRARLEAFYRRPRTKEIRGCSIHAENTGPDENWTSNGPRGRWETGWCWLQSQPMSIIALFRTDVLAQLASSQTAALLQRWQEQPQKDRPVYSVPPEKLRRFHDDMVWRWIYRLRMFPGHRKLLVEYETLTTDWDRVMDEIQRWLQVTPVTLPQALTKQERRPLEEVLTNYEELRQIADGLPKIFDVAREYLPEASYTVIR